MLGRRQRALDLPLFPKTKAIGPLSRPTKSPLSLSPLHTNIRKYVGWTSLKFPWSKNSPCHGREREREKDNQPPPTPTTQRRRVAKEKGTWPKMISRGQRKDGYQCGERTCAGHGNIGEIILVNLCRGSLGKSKVAEDFPHVVRGRQNSVQQWGPYLGFGWAVAAAAGWGRAWGVWAGPGLVCMRGGVVAAAWLWGAV